MLYPLLLLLVTLQLMQGKQLHRQQVVLQVWCLRNVSANNSIEITDVTGVFDTTNTQVVQDQVH